jgi:hypothetical protein
VKKTTFILFTGLLLAPVLAHAQSDSLNGVFAQALVDGHARAPILQAKTNQEVAMLSFIQRQTHDNGPVFIEATRLFRFKQQAHCGRVKFIYIQPGSKTTLPFGGQMNVCDDGSPPWKVCKNNLKQLVPPQARCADKSIPQDTPEVAAAIKGALLEGELSQDQVIQLMKDGKAKKGISDK